MRQLYLVTHPQATHHTDGLVGGWYDSDLTDLGQRHAEHIAQDLRRRVPADQPVRLVSSDLGRTRQTAEPIAQAFNVSVELDDRFRELHYGAAEGHPTGTHPYAPVPDEGDRMGFVSGQGMETRRQWATRVYAAMTSIMTDAAETSIVVTHSGTLTYAVAAWIGMPLEAADRVKFRASPGGITLLRDDDIHSDHVVAELNTTSHLNYAATE